MKDHLHVYDGTGGPCVICDDWPEVVSLIVADQTITMSLLSPLPDGIYWLTPTKVSKLPDVVGGEQ